MQPQGKTLSLWVPNPQIELPYLCEMVSNIISIDRDEHLPQQRLIRQRKATIPQPDKVNRQIDTLIQLLGSNFLIQ